MAKNKNIPEPLNSKTQKVTDKPKGKKSTRFTDLVHSLTPIAAFFALGITIWQTIESKKWQEQQLIINGENTFQSPYYQYRILVFDEFAKTTGEITAASKNNYTSQKKYFNDLVNKFEILLFGKQKLIEQDTTLYLSLKNFYQIILCYQAGNCIPDPDSPSKSFYEILIPLQNAISSKIRCLIDKQYKIGPIDSLAGQKIRNIELDSMETIEIPHFSND